MCCAHMTDINQANATLAAIPNEIALGEQAPKAIELAMNNARALI